MGYTVDDARMFLLRTREQTAALVLVVEKLRRSGTTEADLPEVCRLLEETREAAGRTSHAVGGYVAACAQFPTGAAVGVVFEAFAALHEANQELLRGWVVVRNELTERDRVLNGRMNRIVSELVRANAVSSEAAEMYLGECE
jgi:hypothetical protein